MILKNYTINVAIGILTDDETEVIKLKQALNVTTKEAVNFINKFYPIKLIQCNMIDHKVRINIAYESDDELHDVTNWFTLEDLANSGLLNLK